MESYANAVKKTQGPGDAGTKYVQTKTVVVRSLQPDTWFKTEDLMEDLQKIDLKIAGFKSRYNEKGCFDVLFKDEDEKEKELEKWKKHAEEKTCKFSPDAENEETKVLQNIILEGIPWEYPTIAVEEYLKKYFVKPKVQYTFWPNTEYLDGNRKITHEGLKRSIERKIYVGPNIPAWIKQQSHQPLANFKLKCKRCLQEGHLHYGCEKQIRCFKCKKEGHQGRECKIECCTICKKTGHEEAKCYFKNTREEAKAQKPAPPIQEKRTEKRIAPGPPEDIQSSTDSTDSTDTESQSDEWQDEMEDEKHEEDQNSEDNEYKMDVQKHKEDIKKLLQAQIAGNEGEWESPNKRAKTGKSKKVKTGNRRSFGEPELKHKSTKG